METTVSNFFRSVLPENGIYALVTKGINDQYLKHTPLNDLDTFLRSVQVASADTKDCWFALANYSQGFYTVTDATGKTVKRFRTQDNAARLRCLFLDVDVGEDKPYQTTVQALQALREFCQAARLPIPTIVYSGSGGLHVYWAFKTSVSKDDWRKLAVNLHNATVKHGFAADPMRTRDCASILRVPGSNNFKRGEVNRVSLQYVAEPMEYDYYLGLLHGYESQDDKTHSVEQEILNAVLKIDWASLGVGSLTLPNIDLSEWETDYPKRKAVDVVAQCRQLQLQNNASEPVWRGMLATLRHCEGGVEMAHQLSRQDKRYDEVDTDEKLSMLASKNIAPYTCKTFSDHRPEVCLSCPHRGKIRSPISVPESKITTVTVDDETGEVEKVVTENVAPEVAKVVMAIPDIDTGRYRVDVTGCYVLETSKDKSKSWWDKFYDFPVYPIQRIKDRDTAGELQVSYIFRKHNKKGYDDFQVLGETLMGQGLYGFLGSVGFLLTQEERKHMAGLMIDLLKEVGSELEETKMMNRLGWDDEMSTFLLGNKLYKSNGDVVQVSPKGNANEYSNMTEPRGSLEQWVKIANVYNKKGLEWGQTAVASAFASPLMPIGSLERAALLFITGDKGVGKSTALSLAVSVFGNPNRMLINKDDTYLARLAKLGIMNNISVGFDEMTDLSPREASELAYQITQGRGKDRMGDGGKSILHNTTYWSCLPVMSANDSIINALAQHSFDSTAQMSRVLEVQARDINEVYSRDEFMDCESLVRSLPQNYGVAGDVYMRWVTTHMTEVKELIRTTEREFLDRTQLTSNYRFWTYMCTRMLVGVMIAKRLGLVQYDVEELFTYFVSLIKNSKARISSQRESDDSLLGSFLNEHIANRIVVASDSRTKDHPPFDPMQGTINDLKYVLHSPSGGRDLQVRIVRDEHIAYISIKAMRKWCADNSVPYDKFIDSINTTAFVVEAKRKVTLGKFTQFSDSARTDCMVIKLPEDLEIDD